MLLIDANVWIGLLVESDSLHSRSASDFDRIAASKELIVMSDHVFSEVSTYFLYHEDKNTLEKFQKLVLGSREVVLRCLEANEACEVSARVGHSSKKLSFTDEALLYLSKKYGYSILTYDSDLAKAK